MSRASRPTSRSLRAVLGAHSSFEYVASSNGPSWRLHVATMRSTAVRWSCCRLPLSDHIASARSALSSLSSRGAPFGSLIAMLSTPSISTKMRVSDSMFAWSSIVEVATIWSTSLVHASSRPNGGNICIC